jgi:hypothetical protein
MTPTPASFLAIDLFCGLGGWTEGLLAEGWRVRGYDIEAHEYGRREIPGELVLRDILTLHGSRSCRRGPDRQFLALHRLQLHGHAVVAGEGQGGGDPGRRDGEALRS